MSPAPRALPPQPYDPAEATREIVASAKALGFSLVGIAPAAPSRWKRFLEDWIQSAKHGSMDYLERDTPLRLDPRGHLPDTRSFVMVADQYAIRGDAAGTIPPGHGAIARYARGRNYHEVIKRRLHKLADAMRLRFPGADFRSFVDTAPVLERELAELAGLGWIGKNTMLIHPRIGSYTLLGGAATNLELAVPVEQTRAADACGTCTRCIDACPTGAITSYSVDASRCVSYLTIERRLPIEPPLAERMGDWLYGCDVCQDVCPHNSPRSEFAPVGEVLPAYRPQRSSLSLLEVMRWDEPARREAFKSSAMKRAPLEVMRRNAVIAAANQLRTRNGARDDELTRTLLAEIRRIAADSGEDPLVRGAAADALARFDLPAGATGGAPADPRTSG
ncbi:MAG: tRNA epoxyqueuosine(34) reductase QueG [Phycisphaerales bacterium]